MRLFLPCFVGRHLCALTLGLSLGCAVESEGGPSSLGAPPPSDESTGAPDPTPTSRPRLDVDGGYDGGDPDAHACSQLDIVFIVDPSASMRNNLQRFAENAPGFVEVLREELASVRSYHVGVINTGYENRIYDSPLYAPCNEFGALVTYDVTESTGCAEPDLSRRFFTQDDDLESLLPCALIPGDTGSSNERPLESLLHALSPGLAQEGACNQGMFRRGGAPLVVVLVTDEDDGGVYADGSPGEPPDWQEALLEATGARESDIVPVVLHWAPPAADNNCTDTVKGERPAPRLIEFVELFSRGLLGDACAEDYRPFLREAVARVGDACEEFLVP